LARNEGKDFMQRTRKFLLVFLAIFFLGFNSTIFSVESNIYRLLSISESEKLVLVSSIPDKRKYLLDASSAKITFNGKSAEFKELKQFSIVQVKVQLGKKKKNAIELDGSAIEISISNPEKPQKDERFKY
jgi:hypothetical protein